MADMKNNIKSGIDDAARAVKSGVNDAASAAKTGADRAADATGGNGGAMGGIRDTAHHLADRAGELAGQAREKVGDLAGQARDKVGDLAGQARDRLGDWTGNINTERVQRFASDAYEAVGEHAGDFGREVASLVRRHPLPAILVGFGLGLLLGRAARSV